MKMVNDERQQQPSFKDFKDALQRDLTANLQVGEVIQLIGITPGGQETKFTFKKVTSNDDFRQLKKPAKRPDVIIDMTFQDYVKIWIYNRELSFGQN